MHTSAVVLQAKKGKSAPAAAAPAVVEKFDLKKQIPVNLLKGASRHCGVAVAGLVEVTTQQLRGGLQADFRSCRRWLRLHQHVPQPLPSAGRETFV